VISYRFAKLLLEQLTVHANQQYLAALEDQFRKTRLLYESGRIAEEDYKKAEVELSRLMKELRSQLKRPSGGAQEIRLL